MLFSFLSRDSRAGKAKESEREREKERNFTAAQKKEREWKEGDLLNMQNVNLLHVCSMYQPCHFLL